MSSKRTARTALLVGFLTLLLAGTAVAAPGDLTLASTSADGVKADGGSPSLSADGSRVAFRSGSTILDPTDTNLVVDIYVKSLVTGDIILASISGSGVKANRDSADPSLSADGTAVAFETSATNLDPGDTDSDIDDVYVKNLVTGSLTLASTSDSGVKSDSFTLDPSLSSDGARVAFYSHAGVLDPADSDYNADIYVKDVVTGNITLASISPSGVKANSNAFYPSLSADGTLVAFNTSATNLDPGDTDQSIDDVYVKNLVTGDLTLASTSDNGVKGNSHSYNPSLSSDGTRVAFHSHATNLDPADTGSDPNIYVKDLITGDISLASTSDSGVKGNSSSVWPTLSADGTKVAFDSVATNLDQADTDTIPDVYVKNLSTGDITLASTSEGGAKGNGESEFSSLSADGSSVAFSSAANNLEPADTDTTLDVYVKELGPPAASADLSVAKSDGRDPVRPGVQLVYRVKVDNLGPNTATDVTVTDWLPAAARFVSARASQGECNRTGRVLSCELGSVPSGGRSNVRVVVVPIRPALIRNTVEVTANESDPSTANNSDVETTRVR
jgi:uncharacterized repeat protein (TIGR01451 family)